jgi:hypothetical protein
MCIYICAVSTKANKKCSPIQINIKETLHCSISMKLIKTKEIVITPLLFSIIFSILISSSINNQQVIAQQQQQQQSPEEIPAYGIRTQYPDGWEILIQSTSPSSISLRFNSPPENDTDIFRENVVFEINTISNNTALSNYTSAALASYLESYPDFELIDLSSTNLTNTAIPAYKLVASRTQDGLDFIQIFAIKEDKVYTISYSSEKTRYSTYLPIIEEMINSFEVTYSSYV